MLCENVSLTANMAIEFPGQSCHSSLSPSANKSSRFLYLELLCELATEAIKHSQVKGAKVRVEAVCERQGDRERGRGGQGGFSFDML